MDQDERIFSPEIFENTYLSRKSIEPSMSRSRGRPAWGRDGSDPRRLVDVTGGRADIGDREARCRPAILRARMDEVFFACRFHMQRRGCIDRQGRTRRTLCAAGRYLVSKLMGRFSWYHLRVNFVEAGGETRESRPQKGEDYSIASGYEAIEWTMGASQTSTVMPSCT